MPPLVVDVMNAHRAALLRRERTQMSAMAQRWLGVERALQAEIVRFTERLHQDGLTLGQIRSRQFQLDRFASLLRQVRNELDRYTDYAAPLITDRQREYAATGIDHAADAINAVGEQAGITIRFDRLPVGAVENLAGLAGDGSPLRALLQGSFGVGAEGMFSQLIAGVALGRNPRVVARMMVRDGLSQSLTRMMLIARTEQLRVYRESSRQTYINSGVVERYKRLAAKSRRTCAACLMADGQIYELDEPFDEHPNGRCQLVPVVTGLPPVRWTEGRDWFVTQSPEIQQSILGPGRFDAWRNGAFDLDQLVSRRENPVWGAALVPTPLRDLLNGTAQPVTIRRETAPEPVPQREVAPIFSKTKEAQEWARQRFPSITINYGKLAPETANVLNQTLIDTFGRIPQLENIVQYVGSGQARNQDIKDYFRPILDARYQATMPNLTKEQREQWVEEALKKYVHKIPGSVYAYSHSGQPGTAWERFKGITINEKFGKNFASMTQSLQNDELGGWHPIGSGSIKGIIDHELGHEIDKLLNLVDSKNKNQVNDLNFLPIIRQIESMPGKVDGNLSRYAAANYKEIVAEAWTEYINNPTPREPARLIGEYIMQKVSQLP